MEDGAVVAAELPNVIGLMKQGAQVEEVLELLQALQKAAETCPQLFRGTSKTLPLLLETLISNDIEDRVVAEGANTLVAIASALLLLLEEAEASEKVVNDAVALLIRHGKIADPSFTRLAVLQDLVSKLFSGSRLWLLCSSERRFSALQTCLQGVLASRSSQKASDWIKVLRSVVQAEISIPSGGVGAYLGTITVRVVGDSAASLSCAMQLLETTEALCERDTSNGLAALAVIFDSDRVKRHFAIALEEGPHQSRQLCVSLLSCVTILLDNAHLLDRARAALFAVQLLHERFIAMLGTRESHVFAAGCAKLLTDAFGVLDNPNVAESALGSELMNESSKAMKQLKNLCTNFGVDTSLEKKALLHVGIGNLLAQLPVDKSAALSEQFLGSAAGVLEMLSARLNSQREARRLAELALDLCNVFCRIGGTDAAIHILLPTLSAVLASCSSLAKEVGTVLDLLPCPKTSHDADHVIQWMETMLEQGRRMPSLHLVVATSRLVSLLSASEMQEKRDRTKDMVRSFLPWIFSFLEVNLSSSVNDEAAQECFGHLICAGSLCAFQTTQSTSSCCGNCAVDIWDSFTKNIEPAMERFDRLQSVPLACAHLRSVGKLLFHSNPIRLAGMGKLALSALEKLWHDDSMVRRAAGVSAEHILRLATRISMASQDGMILGTEDSADPLFSERDSVLWRFVERLRAHGRHNSGEEAYIDALRIVCKLTSRGELQAIVLGELLNEVVLDSKLLANREMNAYEALVDVARKFSNKRKSAAAVAELIRGSYRDILPLFLNRMLDEDHITQLLSNLADTDVEDLWMKVPGTVLPGLVRSGDIDTITKLAQRLSKAPRSLLQLCLPDCLARSLLSRGNKGERLMDNIMNTPFRDLAEEHESEVVIHLVWELGGSRPQTARKALEGLASPGTVQSLLSRSILRVMDSLNLALFGSKRKADRPQALSCLQKMLPLCADEVYMFVPKIMATLKLAIDLPGVELRREAMSAWEVFLKCLSPSQAAPYVVSMLSMFLPHHRTLDTAIFHRLCTFVSEGGLDGHVEQVYEVEILLEEYKVGEFGESCERLLASIPPNAVSFKQLAVISTSHESASFRQLALKSLYKKLVRSRRNLMEVADIGSVVQRLLRGLSFRDETYGLLCLKCLAEIGAPYPLVLNGPKTLAGRDEGQGSLPRSSTDLAEELLRKYLVPALRSGESRGGGERQNQLGFSIQEILRIHGCTPETPRDLELRQTQERYAMDLDADDELTQDENRRREGLSFWSRLSDDVRAAVKPYLEAHFESTFRAQANGSQSGKLSDRLHILRAGMEAVEWVKEFTARIVDILDDEQVSSAVLKASRVVIRNDYNVAFFCLPHAVVALVSSSEGEPLVKTIASELLRALSFNEETIQVSFQVLDMVQRINAQLPQKENTGKATDERRSLNLLSPTFYDSILPPDQLAEAAAKISASARVILYLEEAVRRSVTGDLSSGDVQMLEEAYAEQEDLDDLIGVTALRNDLTIEGKLLEAETNGNYDDQLVLYQQNVSQMPDNMKAHGRYMQCLKTLGYWEGVLSHSQSLLKKQSANESEVCSYMSEAAWRLSRWDAFDEMKTIPFSRNAAAWDADYERHLGKLFHCLHKGEKTLFRGELKKAMGTLLNPIKSASLVGYRQSLSLLSKAHVLAIVEDAMEQPMPCSLLDLDTRVEAMSPSLRAREPALSCRMACLLITGKKREASEVCMKLAKTARKSGNLVAALASANRAQQLGSEMAIFEIAKVHYLRGQKLLAISSLSREKERREDGKTSLNLDSDYQGAKLNLLLGRWMDDTNSAPASEILRHYRQAVELAPTSDKTFYVLGRFYDHLFSATQQLPDEKPESHLPTGARARPMVPSEFSALDGTATISYEYIPWILKQWTETMSLSSRYVHQVLPRCLTLWFDFFTMVHQKGSQVQQFADLQDQVKERIRILIEKTPKSFWMSTMPQLLSRLLHPHSWVEETLMDLIASVTAAYPHQALWYVVPVTRSQDGARASRAKRIVQLAIERSDKSTTAEILRDAGLLVKELIRVCTQAVPQKTRQVHGKSTFKLLNKLFPSRIIIPTQSALSHAPDSFVESEYNVTFQDMDDQVILMPSLMKPKKVTFLGSDGKRYIYLCKREDSGDMRKDSRLMQFARVVNRLLSKYTPSRERSLSLRTYEVLPLNEECGLVEWVDNLVSIRSAYYSMYRARGFNTSFQEIMRAKEKKTCSDVEFFDEWVLPLFPKMMHSYFVKKFPDPSQWLEARRRFTRSVAVWSITGYIVGLGDRHGENITIEVSSGTCVHVDFACLFEKGLTLKVPELVPFRLTRNILDAMGTHSPEGAFRRLSEMTLRCLRQNKETLMSVLETFLHDPLVEWNSQGLGRGKSTNKAPLANEYARKTLRAIERKLEGFVGSGLPLSIEGQVQRLIHEATTSENLAKMYAGWMPWI